MSSLYLNNLNRWPHKLSLNVVGQVCTGGGGNKTGRGGKTVKFHVANLHGQSLYNLQNAQDAEYLYTVA